MAAGLYPYRIVPEPARAITLADSYIERSFCPYVRSCLGQALEGHYQFLKGLVVVNSCDPMRRMYDAWRYYVGGDFITLLDLPRIDSALAVEYYRECLLKFIDELESGGVMSKYSDPLANGTIIADANQIRVAIVYVG